MSSAESVCVFGCSDRDGRASTVPRFSKAKVNHAQKQSRDTIPFSTAFGALYGVPQLHIAVSLHLRSEDYGVGVRNISEVSPSSDTDGKCSGSVNVGLHANI